MIHYRMVSTLIKLKKLLKGSFHLFCYISTNGSEFVLTLFVVVNFIDALVY